MTDGPNGCRQLRVERKLRAQTTTWKPVPIHSTVALGPVARRLATVISKLGSNNVNARPPSASCDEGVVPDREGNLASIPTAFAQKSGDPPPTVATSRPGRRRRAPAQS